MESYWWYIIILGVAGLLAWGYIHDKIQDRKYDRFTFRGHDFDIRDTDPATKLPRIPAGWSWQVWDEKSDGHDYLYVRLLDDQAKAVGPYNYRLWYDTYSSEQEVKDEIRQYARKILGDVRDEQAKFDVTTLVGVYPPKSL